MPRPLGLPARRYRPRTLGLAVLRLLGLVPMVRRPTDGTHRARDATTDEDAIVKIAIDTCVGIRGRLFLERAGHDVVVEAERGEMDQIWFARALKAGAELVVSADSDLEIHCYDHRIEFFRAKQRHSGLLTAQRVLLKYPSQARGTTANEDTSMKPMEHSDPINGAMCEVVSAMSALNMEPNPLTETGDPDSNGYLSEVDGWAKHAMEHLNAAAALLLKAQTPKLVASTADLNVLEALRNRAWLAEDTATVAALDRVLMSRLPSPPALTELKCPALTETDVMALVWVRQFADSPARAALDKIVSFFTRQEG